MVAVSGYDGFISYSHRHDAVLGPVLQASVARFTKPWYRMRALKIFVDTADLAEPAYPARQPGLNANRQHESDIEPQASGHPAKITKACRRAEGPKLNLQDLPRATENSFWIFRVQVYDKSRPA